MILSRPGFALALLSLASTVGAQDRNTLEKAIPASCYFAYTYAGWDACARAWKDLSVAPMVHDLMATALDRPEAREALAAMDREVTPELTAELRRWRIDPEALRTLASAPSALLIGRPTIAGGIPLPSVAIVMAIEGKNRTAWTSLLGVLGQHLTVAEAKLGNRSVHRVEVPDAPGLDGIWIGEEKQLVAISNSAGLLQEIFDTAQGRRPRATAQGAFRSGLQRTRGRTLANFWINTEPLMAALQPMLPYEAEDIADALGLGRMTGIYGAASARGASSEEVLHIGWEGAMDGLFRAPFKPGASRDVASWCSPETVAFGRMRFDPSRAMGDVALLMQRIPGWLHREVSRELERETGAGLHEMSSLLSHYARQAKLFTGDLTLACVMPKNLPIPEVTLFLGVRDGDAVRAEFRGLMQGLDREESYREQTFLKTAIHSIQVKIDKVGIAPCFCIKNGVLMISSHPRVLKATLRRIDNSSASLAAEPSFLAAQKQAEGAAVFGYLAAGRLAKTLLGSRQLMQMLAQEADFDVEMIPEGDDLEEALGSMSITGHLDDKGFTWKWVSPFGYGSLLAGQGVALRWLSQRLLGTAPAKPARPVKKRF